MIISTPQVYVCTSVLTQGRGRDRCRPGSHSQLRRLVSSRIALAMVTGLLLQALSSRQDLTRVVPQS